MLAYRRFGTPCDVGPFELLKQQVSSVAGALLALRCCGLLYLTQGGGQVRDVGLRPYRVVEVKVRLRFGKVVVDQPGGLGIAKIELSTPGGGDDGQAREHGFGQRQAKTLCTAGRNERMASFVEGFQSLVGVVAFQDLHIGVVGVASACLRQPLVNFVVGVGKGFDDEADIVLRTECLSVRLEHGVGAFARETRRHVKESEAFGLELISGFGLHAFPMVDTDAHIDHGYPHTVVHHDFGDVFRHDRQALEVGIEVMHPWRRKLAFFPAVTLQGVDAPDHVVHSGGVGESADDVGGILCEAFRALVQAGDVGVCGHKAGLWREVARAFRGVQCDIVADGLEGFGEFTVDEREAVRAVEWAFGAPSQVAGQPGRRRLLFIGRDAGCHGAEVRVGAALECLEGRGQIVEVAGQARWCRWPAVRIGRVGLGALGVLAFHAGQSHARRLVPREVAALLLTVRNELASKGFIGQRLAHFFAQVLDAVRVKQRGVQAHDFGQ